MQNSADVLNQLRSYQTSRRKPQDILAEEETKLGIPSAQQRLTGLRGAISNTENLLRNVDPSVTGRTAGTFTTEAQRQKIVAQERAPISDQFREQSRALEGETANVADLSTRALNAARLGLSEQDAQENSLRTLYASLYQREQDAIARAERERALEEEKKRAAAQLAAISRYYSPTIPTAPVDNSGRNAAIIAEAKRLERPGLVQAANKAAEESRRATEQTNRYSGLGGFLNYIGEKGPLALFGF